MRLHSVLIISAGFVSLFACEKTITITPPPYQDRVSIQCMLEPDSLPILYFNKTVPYFDKKLSFSDLVIRNANIIISDGITSDILLLDSVYDRIYCQHNYFYRGAAPIRLNRSYTLNIINGTDNYVAVTSTSNLSRTIIDSTSFTKVFKDLYGEHEGVIVYFTDILSQNNYYRYEMIRYVDTTTKKASEKLVSPCLGRDSVKVDELGRSVYSDVGQNGLQLKLVIEPAYSHKPGTKGLIFIQNIDKNAYEFFDQLDRQKLAQFNPFVEPVFLKDGQFGAKAVGYFSAMVKSYPVNYFYPE
jgi:Domain of unknown function (DUF4249)